MGFPEGDWAGGGAHDGRRRWKPFAFGLTIVLVWTLIPSRVDAALWGIRGIGAKAVYRHQVRDAVGHGNVHTLYHDQQSQYGTHTTYPTQIGFSNGEFIAVGITRGNKFSSDVGCPQTSNIINNSPPYAPDNWDDWILYTDWYKAGRYCAYSHGIASYFGSGSSQRTFWIDYLGDPPDNDCSSFKTGYNGTQLEVHAGIGDCSGTLYNGLEVEGICDGDTCYDPNGNWASHRRDNQDYRQRTGESVTGWMGWGSGRYYIYEGNYRWAPSGDRIWCTYYMGHQSCL